MLRTIKIVPMGILVATVLTVATFAYANHAWGNYHWARTTNPFTLKVGNNLSVAWNPYLITTVSDWSVSNVLDVVTVPSYKGKNCRPTTGRDEVCNGSYGKNGWLGIASIWVNGDHVTQGTVRVNDSYFNTSTYNTPAWKNLVMCQEVAHTLGLDHQDENFSNPNLNTCMDYTSSPESNQHPNQHDYDMLETIYAHLDSVTTLSPMIVSGARNFDPENAREWGRELRKTRDGRASLHMRDYGNGEKVFTFVIWADETATDHK